MLAHRVASFAKVTRRIVQGAAHCLGDSHNYIGHVTDRIETDVGCETAGRVVGRGWSTGCLEDKRRAKGEDGQGAREDLIRDSFGFF